jgi:hypothetical protein
LNVPIRIKRDTNVAIRRARKILHSRHLDAFRS